MDGFDKPDSGNSSHCADFVRYSTVHIFASEKADFNRCFSFSSDIVCYVYCNDRQCNIGSGFNIFACFDIGIFAFTVVFMFIELRTILLSVYSDRTVKNTDKAENDKAAANSV